MLGAQGRQPRHGLAEVAPDRIGGRLRVMSLERREDLAVIGQDAPDLWRVPEIEAPHPVQVTRTRADELVQLGKPHGGEHHLVKGFVELLEGPDLVALLGQGVLHADDGAQPRDRGLVDDGGQDVHHLELDGPAQEQGLVDLVRIDAGHDSLGLGKDLDQPLAFQLLERVAQRRLADVVFLRQRRAAEHGIGRQVERDDAPAQGIQRPPGGRGHRPRGGVAAQALHQTGKEVLVLHADIHIPRS
ncbi:hypothetical protein Salmuc_04322 [Salipiger mucosus DSM 16094]|uniref:Uncharacterized protein n=1 Tax=Salipiger mucosus DSM 16094 TaxID=1123237 RepID=S9RKT3_9RHOB|nr:hypothetical protein Salmuc_04322 [Salipiger mucosus DSM 16094]